MTTPGFEKVLAEEVGKLPGVSAVSTLRGGVGFFGPLQTMYHANLLLRSANRVLLRIDSFVARSLPELFQKSKSVPWELYTGFEKSVAFEASSSVSRLHHTDTIIAAVNDGLGHRLKRLRLGVTPADDAAIRFFIRFSHDTCRISIDTSGELLHKRGYRQEIGHAPLRETIAAALLMHCGWERYPVIADPLCGSGTFCIEAALLALRRAPGQGRAFAFSAWPSYNGTLFERLGRQVKTAEAKACPVRIIGSDISGDSVAAAIANARRAGVHDAIAFTKADCLDFNKDAAFGRSGLVIANLPYGKRAHGRGGDLAALYRRLGETLRKNCSGWDFGFILADHGLFKAMRLEERAVLRFENGGLEVMFVTGSIR